MFGGMSEGIVNLKDSLISTAFSWLPHFAMCFWKDFWSLFLSDVMPVYHVIDSKTLLLLFLLLIIIIIIMTFELVWSLKHLTIDSML